jgi:tetratricopeptide (TPR) repeat protein
MTNFISAYGQQTAEDLCKKGIELSNLNEYEEAIKVLNKSIGIDPEYADAWYNKGNALYYQGKCGDAIEAYDKAIEIKPKLEAAWSNKVAILKGLAQNKELYTTTLSAKNLGINISKSDISPNPCIRGYQSPP